MHTINDIHFHYEHLTSKQRNAFRELKDPLNDATDFLIDPVPKYIADKTKKYLQYLQDAVKNPSLGNPINAITYTFQYAMSAAYLHKKGGKKVIRFQNETVLRQLAETNTFSLLASDLPLPMFESCFIDLGKNGQMLGIFVFFKGDATIDVMVMQDTGHGGVGFSNMVLDLNGKNTLEETAQQTINNGKLWAAEQRILLESNWEEMIRSQINMVFSVLLYLNSAISDPERIIETPLPKRNNNKSGINSKKEAIRQANAYHTFLIKTSAHEQKEYAEGVDALKHGMPLTLVRGHYRRQPIGERGREQYKIIWIKPFWKGSEEMQGKMHIYKVV